MRGGINAAKGMKCLLRLHGLNAKPSEESGAQWEWGQSTGDGQISGPNTGEVLATGSGRLCEC